MAQKQQEPERKTFVTIRHGNREIKLETWRYWKIVGELQFLGVDRIEAVEVAKRVMWAKAGESLSISYYNPILDDKMKTSNAIIQPLEIELEVTDG